MKPLNKYYPVKLWAITLCLGPLIMYIIGCINEGFTGSFELLPLIPLFIFFGVIYSCPVLVLVYITFLALMKYSSSKLLVIIIIAVVSIIGIYVTFYLVGGSMAIELPLFYSAAVILASIAYLVKDNVFRKISN